MGVFSERRVIAGEVSIDEIFENIAQINTIILNGEFNMFDGKSIELNGNHPITYTKFVYNKIISIVKSYYLEHKVEIDNLIKLIIQKKTYLIKIASEELINDEIINLIANNDQLENVQLGSEKSPYILTKAVYDRLKQNKNITSISTTGVSSELEDVFDPIIEYNYKRCLINSYTYKDLQNNKIVINNPINVEEFKNLKYINKDSKIVFDYLDFNNIKEVIDKLKELNHNGKIEISINGKDKPKLNNYLFGLNDLKSFNGVNINCTTDKSLTSVEEYYEYEKYLTNLIEPALSLSPFEKFLYAYNITKNYKPYLENKENKDDSRNLYRLLSNDYMVCVGYSRLLVDLLNKLSIDSEVISVTVDTGFSDVKPDTYDIPENVSTKFGDHARVRVKIVDKKYGINGIYTSDPTWDNSIKYDLYAHALITEEEYKNLGMKNKIENVNYESSLLSSTIEEFYEKINYFLNKLSKKMSEQEARLDIIKHLHKLFENIDTVFYSKVKSEFYDEYYKIYNNLFMSKKHKDINGETKFQIELNKLFVETIEMFGEYIVNNFNNKVSGDTFKSAIELLYSNYYGMNPDEVEQRLNKTMEDNKKYYKISYPEYTEKKEDGTIVVYENIENKFDIDDQKVA